MPYTTEKITHLQTILKKHEHIFTRVDWLIRSPLFIFFGLHGINSLSKLWLWGLTANFLIRDISDITGFFAFTFLFLFFGFFEVSFWILYSRLYTDLNRAKTFGLGRHFRFVLIFWPFSFLVFAILVSGLEDSCNVDVLCSFIRNDIF